jgi:hypothetical protein
MGIAGRDIGLVPIGDDIQLEPPDQRSVAR